jgi:hypothetical protein
MTDFTIRLTVSQSVCFGIEHPWGTCDQILFPVGMLLSEIWGLVSVGRPLWREDGSTICSVITRWPESRRTRNHTLLSHLRLPEPGGPGSRIYILQEQDGPDVPSGTGFPLIRLLRLAGLRRRYSNPPRIHILQERDGPVQSQKSKSRYHRRPDLNCVFYSETVVTWLQPHSTDEFSSTAP